MESPDHVSVLRAFNRMWTARIGVLDAHLHDTPYSLTEARVRFAGAQQRAVEVAALRGALDLDAGYLSRILARFKRERLVTIERSEADARRQIVQLAKAGRAAFKTLNARSAKDMGAMLGALSDREQERLVAAMHEIEHVLDRRPPGVVVIRSPRAGELGWIVERHGAVYAREYGWNDEFEGLVARIVGEYAAKRDREREAAWIAEIDGERVGCVLCVKKNATTARLRLLLVEPAARGYGIGRKLVDECVQFARDRGYKRMVLWTNDVLHAARRIYEAAGFELVASGKHHSFGQDLVEQTWQLRLAEVTRS